MIRKELKGKYFLIGLILLCFGLIYASISFVNHYYFRSYALDLGMFNNALYDFAHFRSNNYSLSLDGSEVNYFGDHFSPLTFLFIPFYFLFGTYALLVVQILSLLFGAVGIYKYARLYLSQKWLPLILLVQFLCIWAAYSSLGFDFHNNVVAAMFVPWLLYFYRLKNWKWFALFFILILVSKENMALWLTFILFALFLERWAMRREGGLRSALKFEGLLSVLAFVYFLTIMAWVMPSLRNGEGYDQLARFGHFGDSLPEIIMGILSDPVSTFKMFFINTHDEALFDGIKAEMHLMMLLAGGFAVFLRPQFLVMLIPIYAQKFLTQDVVVWGINAQYSIEFMPVISLALIHFISGLKSPKFQQGIVLTVLLTTVLSTIATLEERRSVWYDKANMQFYSAIHYRSDLEIDKLYALMDSIPPDASLCTSSVLSPHLAFRKEIYLFPHIKGADYVYILRNSKYNYPLNQHMVDSVLNVLEQNTDYTLRFIDDQVLLFGRNEPASKK